MVKIRLKRIGAKKRPVYRIVVTKSTAPRDGTAIETIGSYNPVSQPKHVSIQEDRALYWMLNGAQPTDTVAYLLKKEGVLEKFFEQRPGARGKFSRLDKRTDVMTRKTLVGSTAPSEPVTEKAALSPEPEAVTVVEQVGADTTAQEPATVEIQAESMPEVAEAAPAEATAAEESVEVVEPEASESSEVVATEDAEPEQAAPEKE